MKLFDRRLLGLLLCVLALTQCTSVSDTQFEVNQKLASPYTKPAAAYLAMAKSQTGMERDALEQMAAGRLIHDGHWREGQTILANQKNLSQDLADKKNILQAKIALMRQRPTSAIRALSKVDNLSVLSLYYQSQYHELLAQAYKDRGNAEDSVGERIKLDKLLPDRASKNNNLSAIWLTLTSLPKSELETMRIEAPDDSDFKGWMSLAAISRQDYDNPQDMLQAVKNWQTNYQSHSANQLLRLSSMDHYLFPKAQHIALLLPMSGPLRGPGHALYDGFVAALNASPQKNSTSYKVYDTNQKEVAELYQHAVEEGANYVIGPLSKPNVKIVSELTHPVPTLLLNDLNQPSKDNAFQFGLSPENEARQVAAKARLNGYTKALIIAPEGAWGEEVVEAFSTQWRQSGGQVTDTLKYTQTAALGQPIKDFLHVNESEARRQQIQKILGQKIQGSARRRQDFDMIFLLAYPSKARQIMPLLRYYYAGNVPVYATSTVYAGYPNSMKDRDLNGITFCDMPWVFHHNLGNKNWPENLNSYNRLYALGMDSFSLSSQLNQLLMFPALGVRDKSGILYLKPSRQISRILAWGQFQNGLAKQTSQQS